MIFSRIKSQTTRPTLAGTDIRDQSQRSVQQKHVHKRDSQVGEDEGRRLKSGRGRKGERSSAERQEGKGKGREGGAGSARSFVPLHLTRPGK